MVHEKRIRIIREAFTFRHYLQNFDNFEKIYKCFLLAREKKKIVKPKSKVRKSKSQSKDLG